jgi:hypothetical protein
MNVLVEHLLAGADVNHDQTQLTLDDYKARRIITRRLVEC